MKPDPAPAGNSRGGPAAQVADDAEAPEAGLSGRTTERGTKPDILCVMRFPPNADGYGASQRSWHLVQALRPHGKVHFVLMFHDGNQDSVNASLAPLEPLVESVTRINVAGWQGTQRKKFGIVPAKVWDMARMRSPETPHFSRQTIHNIAAQLPIRKADIIFAGRLGPAIIIRDMMKRNLVSGRVCVADIDDVLSQFYLRHADNAERRADRAFFRIESRVVAFGEGQIVNSWHGVGVASEENVTSLRAAYPRATIVKVPNVVHRDFLPPPRPGRGFNVLFPGNLNYAPNVQGLQLFVAQAWPTIRQAIPEARLTIVGMNPLPSVVALAGRDNIEVHADVPSLRPFYETCDTVIVPILFGSGTRIKIVEAMAYGRPVVSTSLGAEGLGVQDGRHLLIADGMAEFAQAVVRLRRDPALQAALVDEAHRFQQENYTPSAINQSVADLIERGRQNAARAQASL